MSYLKPQTPMQLNDNYIYPLTTADQVILNNGNRLNSLFKKTIKETATLQVANWSDTLPYIQTITISESTDDYNVDANIVYNGNEADTELNKAAGCISYIKKNHKEITFYCLKEKPMINIPVEITGTCRNTIATVEEGIKLNFDIIGNPRPKTGNTLYWDGNTEGLENLRSQWYKVSSIAPSIEDFSNGYTLLVSNGDEYTENKAPAVEVQANVISIGSSLCIVVTKDNVEVQEGVFVSKGIYFLNVGSMYISSLTIPGFTGFEKDDIEVKENTIWVDTDVPITGYKFSATEPEDMVEGEVWIKTGDDSDVAFDIVEGAKMYPLYVKQYVNGAWVNKIAMSYQNGEWVDWITYLFSAGDYKGTWTPTAYYSSTTSAKKAPTISVDDGSLVISIASGYRGTAFNTTRLNFNGKKKVTITIKYTGGSGSTALLGVVDKMADNFTRLATVGFEIGSYYVNTEIDVSSLGDTNGYIAFLINAVSSTATATITEIKLT